MNTNLKNVFVGFDLDGTLEMPGLPMPVILKQIISHLSKIGINIFFASGKHIDFLKALSGNIGITPALLCAENGGHICNSRDSREVIFGNNTNDLGIFEDLIQKIELPPQRYEHKVSIWSRKFGDQVLLAGEIIEDVIDKNNLILNVYAYPDGDGGLDVVPPGIDKENLLEFIPEGSVIHYFGDGYNDINLMKSMRVVPHTVANAKDIVKETVINKGGYIAKESAGLGVLDGLQKIFAGCCLR